MSTQAQFVGLGAFTGIVTPPAAGTTPTVYDFLRKEVPASMKGNVWSCMLAALATGEQFAWDNAPLVDKQMFLATASSIWLDRRAAGLGVERPASTGMPDEAFRQYAIQTSSRQQTIPAILEMLEPFYGKAALHASAVSTEEPFSLVAGNTLTVTLDGVQVVTVTWRAVDFTSLTSVSAVEMAAAINTQFSTKGVNAVALVEQDSAGKNVVRVFTGTYGARGSIQVVDSGPFPWLFDGVAHSLLAQSRAAYVLTRGVGRAEVVMPATTDVVTRDDTTAAYMSPDSATPGVGAYLYEGVGKGLAVTEVATATAGAALVAGNQYRLVQVADATSFPDTQGWVVFGYGYSYQAGPVPYLGRAGANGILVSPDFTFGANIPIGATVNLLVDDRPPVHTFGDVGDFILTDSPSGRVVAEAAVDAISPAGYVISKTIDYPGDVGLGNAGHATHGVPAISDIVQCYAGTDIDAEVAAARSN